MWKSKYLCIILLTFAKDNKSARILAVFPIPAKSHELVYRPLLLELARRGHEVISVTTGPAFPKGKAPANLTEIDVHDISYRIFKEKVSLKLSDKINDIYTQMNNIKDAIHLIFEKQLEAPEFAKLFEDKVQIDLIIVEAVVRVAMVLSHVFEAPMILASTYGAGFEYGIIGAPMHELLYSSNFRKRLYNLTLWEKVTELFNIFCLKCLFHNMQYDQDKLIKKKFGENTPSLHELKNNVDLMFLNIHPIWEGIRPVPPNVIYLGGLHHSVESLLPKDLKDFLDASKHGVIYVSFGTNIETSQIPSFVIQIMVKVLSRLPYDVLWKWDQDVLPGKTANIRISNFFPQPDLLRHPKLKLFVTQGGLQSTDEAISAGVPLIGVPMITDQWFNSEKYVFHGIGEKMPLESLTEENFRLAINKVIGNESYRRNIIRLRTLMNDQPLTPLERAVWWTEYVLRHKGAKHLRTPIANSFWFEFIELIFFLLAFILFFTTIFVIGIFIYIAHKLCRKPKNVKAKMA